MVFKRIILFTFGLAILTMGSYEGTTAEAMDLIGVPTPVREYEMHELGGSLQLSPNPQNVNQPNTIPTKISPLDDLMDLITSIKFWAITLSHSFKSQPAQVDRKRINVAEEQKTGVAEPQS